MAPRISNLGKPPNGTSHWLDEQIQRDKAHKAAAEQDIKRKGGKESPAAPLPAAVADRCQIPAAAAPPVPSVKPKRPPMTRQLEPYHPFPVDALPWPLGAFVRAGSVSTGCDSSMFALPALAAAAGLIGNTRVIRLRDGWEEPSILWLTVVSESGTLKTPAMKKAMSHVFKIEERLRKNNQTEAAEYERDLDAYREEKRKCKSKGKVSDAGDPPLKSPKKRIVCRETTIEAIAPMLEDNPRGILVSRDELAGWIGSFTRYKGSQGGSDLPNWLELWDAGTVIVDRKGGERNSLFIRRGCVSVNGGIQPGTLATCLTRDHLDAGLAARLLLAMPSKKEKKWTEAKIDRETWQAYELTLDGLWNLDFAEDDNGDAAPHVLKMNAAAKALWIDWYNEWAREQVLAEGEVAAAYSKIEAYAARLALVHHVVKHVGRNFDDRVEIEKDSMAAGITLARWFAGEARRIYPILSETEAERDTRHLVEYVQGRGNAITVKELQRSNWRKYPSSSFAENALEGLVNAGLGSWRDKPAGSRGGRPTKEFILSQNLSDETDETPS